MTHLIGIRIGHALSESIIGEAGKSQHMIQIVGTIEVIRHVSRAEDSRYSCRSIFLCVLTGPPVSGLS